MLNNLPTENQEPQQQEEYKNVIIERSNGLLQNSEYQF